MGIEKKTDLEKHFSKKIVKVYFLAKNTTVNKQAV